MRRWGSFGSSSNSAGSNRFYEIEKELLPSLFSNDCVTPEEGVGRLTRDLHTLIETPLNSLYSPFTPSNTLFSHP